MGMTPGSSEADYKLYERLQNARGSQESEYRNCGFQGYDTIYCGTQERMHRSVRFHIRGDFNY